MICILSLHDALPIWLRSFAASWLLNALLRIFAMSIITPKRKVLRMSVQDRKSGSAGMHRPISYCVFRVITKRKSYNQFYLLTTTSRAIPADVEYFDLSAPMIGGVVLPAVTPSDK